MASVARALVSRYSANEIVGEAADRIAGLIGRIGDLRRHTVAVRGDRVDDCPFAPR